MHSVLQLLQGLRDLVVLPLEQYQKDGRLIKGLQMGANRFTSSTAVSILELTHRLLGAVRFVAEIAFDVMSPEALIVTGDSVGNFTLIDSTISKSIVMAM